MKTRLALIGSVCLTVVIALSTVWAVQKTVQYAKTYKVEKQREWQKTQQTVRQSRATVVKASKQDIYIWKVTISYEGFDGKLTTSDMVVDENDIQGFPVRVYRSGRVEKGTVKKPSTDDGDMALVVGFVGIIFTGFCGWMAFTYLTYYLDDRKKAVLARKAEKAFGAPSAQEKQLLALIGTLQLSPSKENMARIQRAESLLTIARDNKTRANLQADIALDNIERELTLAQNASNQARAEIASS